MSSETGHEIAQAIRWLGVSLIAAAFTLGSALVIVWGR